MVSYQNYRGKLDEYEGHMRQLTVTLPVDYGILPKLQGEIGQYECHMCHVTVDYVH